eukprot:170726-Alexandrium_andersonii.AAC.1
MAPAARATSRSPRGEPRSPKTGPKEVTAMPGAHPLRWKVRARARSMLCCSVCAGRNVRAGYGASDAT